MIPKTINHLTEAAWESLNQAYKSLKLNFEDGDCRFSGCSMREGGFASLSWRREVTIFEEEDDAMMLLF